MRYNKCILCDKITDRKSGICRSCMMKKIRDEQKADPVRAKQYHDKVSANMKMKHASGERRESYKKAGETIKKNNSLLSKEELKIKYDYYYKMPEYKRTEHLKNILQNGCHKWWKEASENQKRQVILKRRQSLIKTWETKGIEILKKMKETSKRNLNSHENLTDEQINRIINSLNEALECGFENYEIQI